MLTYPAFLDDNAEKTKGWYPSPKTNQNVRSVFLIQKRTVRVPFMETFDMPENSVSCARRNESIVAPQALSLLNSSLTIEAARALAERVQRGAGTDAAKQVERAFALTLQRAPDKTERAACVALLQERAAGLQPAEVSSVRARSGESITAGNGHRRQLQNGGTLALAELCRALQRE